MENVINFVKKPVVWVTALVVFMIGGIVTLAFRKK